MDNNKKLLGAGLSRRDFLRASGVVVGGSLLAGFSSAPLLAAEKVIRIGYVSPQTGPLAPFAAADAYIIESLASVLKNSMPRSFSPTCGKPSTSVKNLRERSRSLTLSTRCPTLLILNAMVWSFCIMRLDSIAVANDVNRTNR